MEENENTTGSRKILLSGFFPLRGPPPNPIKKIILQKNLAVSGSTPSLLIGKNPLSSILRIPLLQEREEFDQVETEKRQIWKIVKTLFKSLNRQTKHEHW